MTEYIYSEATAPEGAPLLLVFHGTGGDENQFFALGRQLLPNGRIIAPRGDVSEGGALRYFRRRGEGQYDMADLARATAKMGQFIAARIAETKPAQVIGLGYSNGANILASVQLSAAQLLDATVLMHPLIPFQPAPQPHLQGRRVLFTAGKHDPMAPAPITQQLVAYYGAQGAITQTFWHDGGHELRNAEWREAQRFVMAVCGQGKADDAAL